MQPHSKTATELLLLLVTALALRLVFCGFVVGWERAPAGDEIDYHYLAAHLSNGEGYRLEDGQITVRRPPLYPLILAAVYRTTGVSVPWGRFFQILLGTGIVALVFFVTRRLFTVGAAWVAAGLTAFNPYLIFISAYLLTENLYAVLLLLSVLVAAKASPLVGSPRRAALMGLLLGLACLCRPTAAMVVLWLAVTGLLFDGGRFRGRAVRVVALVGMALLPLLPWAIRNHVVFDRWIFSTSHGGITFYQGNNAAVLEYPQYYGGVAPLYMLPGYDALKSKPEIQKDEAAGTMGRSFLLNNKSRVPMLVWRKFARFWRFKSDMGLSGVRSGWWWDKESPLGRLATVLDAGLVYSIFVIPLFVLGFIAGLTHRRRFVLLAGLVIVHTFVALVFHGSLRMRIPIEPVMAMFAADATWRLVTRVRTRQTIRP